MATDRQYSRDELRGNRGYLAFSTANEMLVREMVEHADRLFDLNWLRKELWSKLQAVVAKTEVKNSINFNHVFRLNPEQQFMWEYIRHCGTTLADVKRIVDYQYEEENLRVSLCEEREQWIRTLITIPFAAKWTNVSQFKTGSWETFAHRIPFDNHAESEEINSFFSIIDRISILTDILNNHGAYYGLDIDIYDYESPLEELTWELFVKCVEVCTSYFNKESSKWAAIYRILKIKKLKLELDGEIVNANLSKFEKVARRIHAMIPDVPDCPPSTISHAINNNKIDTVLSRWPKGDMRDLADKFSQTLDNMGRLD